MAYRSAEERKTMSAKTAHAQVTSIPNLRKMPQFYLTCCEDSALPEALGGAASRPKKRSALPSVSASSNIRSANRVEAIGQRS
jgi:hypothetical protein